MLKLTLTIIFILGCGLNLYFTGVMNLTSTSFNGMFKSLLTNRIIALCTLSFYKQGNLRYFQQTWDRFRML